MEVRLSGILFSTRILRIPYRNVWKYAEILEVIHTLSGSNPYFEWVRTLVDGAKHAGYSLRVRKILFYKNSSTHNVKSIPLEKQWRI